MHLRKKYSTVQAKILPHKQRICRIRAKKRIFHVVICSYIGIAYSISRLFQIRHQLNIKFAHIEALYIFAVQVYHIGMGNPSLSLGNEQLIVASPLKGIRAHKPVVFPVEIFYKSVCQIQRKSTRGRLSLKRADRAAVYARRVGKLLISLPAFFISQVKNRREKIRICIAQLCRRAIICICEKIFEFFGRFPE